MTEQEKAASFFFAYALALALMSGMHSERLMVGVIVWAACNVLYYLRKA